MQIKINIKIILFIIIFLISGQIEIYGIFMLFALIHELGHLLSGVILGLKLDYITIMPLGLSITFKTNAEDCNKPNQKSVKRILIAMSGPLVNIIIAVIFMITKQDLYQISNSVVVYTNLLIGIFNLVLIYPLDGGRILKEILHIKYGLKKSTIYLNQVAYISIIALTVVASLAIYYYKNIAILITLIYLWYLVIVLNKKTNLELKIYNIVEKNSCKTI